MSRLRAKCPRCETLTAVALGGDYQCHSCGAEFRAGLMRVPRAWGSGGEAMVEAAFLELPYPECGVIAENTLAEQSLALALDLPDRPLVLGGCCCAHIGAVEALSARHGRLAVVWLDAHGDLNTLETSPSGNPWATPLRMLIDGGTVRAEDVALVGARRLDPPEADYIARNGVRTGKDAFEDALSGTEGVYVALDADVLDPGEVSSFMPEPGGLGLRETEELLERVAKTVTVLGAGISGLRADPRNVEPMVRLCTKLGL